VCARPFTWSLWVVTPATGKRHPVRAAWVAGQLQVGVEFGKTRAAPAGLVPTGQFTRQSARWKTLPNLTLSATCFFIDHWLADAFLPCSPDAFVWDLHISLIDRLHSKCSTLASSNATFSSATASDDGETDDTNMDEDGDMDPAPTSLKLDSHTVSSLCHGLSAEVLEMPALQILIANSETVPEARQKDGTLVMYDCFIRRQR
jgi:hypothetical protein